MTSAAMHYWCSYAALQAQSRADPTLPSSQLLLQHGARGDARKSAALMVAVGGSWDDAVHRLPWAINSQLVQLLLESGPRAADRECEALVHASRRGCVASVKLLLQHGADAEAGSSQALVEACDRAHTSVALDLLDAGARADTQDNTSLVRFCSYCHYSNAVPGMLALVTRLLTGGAQADAQDGAPLFNTVASKSDEAAATVRALLEAGARPDERIFLNACGYGGTKDVVRVLVESGADVGAWGGAALQAACRFGSTGMVQVLLEVAAGADVAAWGGAALQAACHLCCAGVVRELLQAGASVPVGQSLWVSTSSKRGERSRLVRLLQAAGLAVKP